MTKPVGDAPELEVEQAVEDIINQLGEQIALQRGVPVIKPARQVSGSSHSSDRIQTRDMQPLNANELKSVYALLAYIANNENLRQETVQVIIEAKFNVNHITKIPHKDYEEVIRFLIDLRIDEMKH
ncbi:MAG: hypothetical protein AB7H77_06935 [Bdellovibrionales bacterium]